MTKDEMQALVKKHGSKAAAAKAIGMPRQTFSDRLAGMPEAKPSEAPAVRGFQLKPDTRMASKRPASSLRSRFFTLKRGMAYKESELAREWVVSPETVRKHAQDAECFRYIEVGNEQWEPCVMHPDTAKDYPVK
jgi:hypothetical protein